MAYGVSALKKNGVAEDFIGKKLNVKEWLKATGVIVVAGILGVAANASSLYHTYEYSKESMRGKSELTPAATTQSGAAKAASSSGLSYDYITGWSYGIGETFTLMIPDFKGGGSGESMLATPQAEENEQFMDQV